MTTLFRFLSIAALLFLAGCGYHQVRTTATGLPEGVTSLAVQPVANATMEPRLAPQLTNALREEFARRGQVTLESAENAAAELTGKVTAYQVVPLAYNAADKVREYRALATVTASLRRRADGKVLWQGGANAGQNFPANDDLALQHNSEVAAIQEIARQLAEQLHRRLTDRF